MLKHVLLAAALTLPFSVAQAAPADVAAAVSAPGRPAEAVQLDEVRRPAEVLSWLGLERGDRVLDYFTGNGYYAEIMARAVGPEGSVTGWNAPGFSRKICGAAVFVTYSVPSAATTMSLQIVALPGNAALSLPSPVARSKPFR